MRIIGGDNRGRRLACPRGVATRPTSDRVKEAIFSILRDRIQDAVVLDLYAGTGALGLEALSRGAARAVFVERSAQAVQALRKNIQACGFEDRAQAVRASVLPYLRSARLPDRVDLVFIDPPYGGRDGALTLQALTCHTEHLAGGTIVLEHAAGDEPTAVPEGLAVADARKWGDTAVTFLTVKREG